MTPTKNLHLPISVTILTVFVLFMTSWYGIRIYSAIANWQVLIEFGASPVYILGTGILWALAGMGLIVVFWQAKPYAPAAGSATAGAYYAWYWLDRLVLQPAPAPNVLFSMIVSTLSLAVFIIILNIPASKSFFNKER